MKNFDSLLERMIRIFIVLPVIFFGTLAIGFFFITPICEQRNDLLNCGPIIFIGACVVTLLVFILSFIYQKNKGTAVPTAAPESLPPVEKPKSIFRGIGYIIWGIFGSVAVTIIFYIFLQISSFRDVAVGSGHEPSIWNAVPAGVLIFIYYLRKWYIEFSS